MMLFFISLITMIRCFMREMSFEGCELTVFVCVDLKLFCGNELYRKNVKRVVNALSPHLEHLRVIDNSHKLNIDFSENLRHNKSQICETKIENLEDFDIEKCTEIAVHNAYNMFKKKVSVVLLKDREFNEKILQEIILPFYIENSKFELFEIEDWELKEIFCGNVMSCYAEPMQMGVITDVEQCKKSPLHKRCDYKCGKDYNQQIDYFARCDYNGYWEMVECEIKKCTTAPSKIEHSNFNVNNCANTDIGDSCYMNCIRDYGIKNPEVHCVLQTKDDLEGIWVGKPRCFLMYPNKCAHAPELKHAGISIKLCANKTVGLRCFIDCEEGYRPTKAFLRCLRDGEVPSMTYWEGVGKCVEKRCKILPIVSNSLGYMSHCHSKPRGYICKTICDLLTVPVDGDYICAKNGTWLGKGRCKPKWCVGYPKVTHSGDEMKRCADFTIDSICKTVCDKFHNPVMGDYECQLVYPRQYYADWIGRGICIKKKCPNYPKIRNSSYQMRKCANKNINDSCTLSCSETSDPIGSEFVCRLVKEEDTKGVWIGSGKCIEKICGTLPDIENLNKNETQCYSLKIGEICPLSCKQGYITKGIDFKCVKNDMNDGSAEFQGDAFCAAKPFHILKYNSYKKNENFDKDESFDCHFEKCVSAPKIANSIDSEACKGTPVGKQCYLQCKKAFYKLGRNPWCHEGGQWEDGVVCAANRTVYGAIIMFLGYMVTFGLVLTAMFYNRRELMKIYRLKIVGLNLKE